jgi:hypothetical protein
MFPSWATPAGAAGAIVAAPTARGAQGGARAARRTSAPQTAASARRRRAPPCGGRHCGRRRWRPGGAGRIGASGDGTPPRRQETPPARPTSVLWGPAVTTGWRATSPCACLPGGSDSHGAGGALALTGCRLAARDRLPSRPHTARPTRFLRARRRPWLVRHCILHFPTKRADFTMGDWCGSVTRVPLG